MFVTQFLINQGTYSLNTLGIAEVMGMLISGKDLKLLMILDIILQFIIHNNRYIKIDSFV